MKKFGDKNKLPDASSTAIFVGVKKSNIFAKIRKGFYLQTYTNFYALASVSYVLLSYFGQ
jgi:hypothetical protein